MLNLTYLQEKPEIAYLTSHSQEQHLFMQDILLAHILVRKTRKNHLYVTFARTAPIYARYSKTAKYDPYIAFHA
jgi:hypothetical protein